MGIKNFWQNLKKWQRIIIVFFIMFLILILCISFPLKKINENTNLTSIETEKEKIKKLYNTFLTAEKNCNIKLATSLITEKSKEIVKFTCSNMANESKCYIGRDYEIRNNDNNAVIYLTPIIYQIENPFFVAKENGKWKFDFYKMSQGIAMGGYDCNTGWVWINKETQTEFCNFFRGKNIEVCEEESYLNTNLNNKNEIEIKIDKNEYQQGEEVELSIKNNLSYDIRIAQISVESLFPTSDMSETPVWEEARVDIFCPCGQKCEQYTPLIRAGEQKDFKWDQVKMNFDETDNFSDNDNFSPIIPCSLKGGYFRFKIDYCGASLSLSRQEAECQNIYSNEFYINEIAAEYLPPQLDELKICEKDSDCTITRYSQNQCCIGCDVHPISLEGERKQKEWRENNCDAKDYVCPTTKCSIWPDLEAKCVDNQCQLPEERECENLKEHIQTLLDEVKTCQKDSDCFIDENITIGCPFGCYFLRSHNYDDSRLLFLIKAKIEEEYNNKCPICENKCPYIEDATFKCINNKCELWFE